MDLKSWENSGSYFDFRGHQIFYRLSSGPGQVLLCLHGFPTSSYDYKKIWDELCQNFTVICFDMIGYGFSDKPADFPYTTFDQVDILEALLDHLRIEGIHILAHDYGNTITQELLSRIEEGRINVTLESICLLNGALFPETHRPILAQRILISPIGFLFGRLISDSRFKQSLASVFGPSSQPSKAELDDFVALFRHKGGKKIAHKLIRYMSERSKYRERWVGALARTDVPIRLINGLSDPVSGAHLVSRFREVLPHRDIVELIEIGHFPHIETPAETLKSFFEFHAKTT